MKTSIATLLLLTATAAAEDAPATPDTPPAAETKPKEAKKETAAIEPLSASESVSVSKDAPATTDKTALEVGDVRFELHGYARMPLSAQSTPREPYLVDNDYYLSGFGYT